jgi:hypothetical protein
MESVILLLVGVLAAAVVYLFMSSRNYQRIDYSAILQQDDYVRALDGRIEYLEELIVLQQEQMELRQQDQEELLTAARLHFSQLAAAASEPPPPQPARPEPAPLPKPVTAPDAETAPSDNLQPKYDAVTLDALRELELWKQHPEMTHASAAPRPRTLPFIRNPRHREIANYLEAGYSPAEVAQALKASRHEIELVEAIVFNRTQTA